MNTRPFLAILSARFRMMLQYRAAAIAGLWTQVFFGLVLLMIYEAFYQSSSAAQPITFPQIVGYVWLGQVLFAMLPWNADNEIAAMIRSGALAYELCRPIDLYWLWFARALAWRTAPTVLRAAPMLLFAMLILPLIGLDEWRLAPPPSIASGAAFVASMVSALAMTCAITTLINITLIWTIASEGIVVIAAAAFMLFSGMIIPLPLLPEWAQSALSWLPFAGIVDLPFRLYTANIAASGVWVVLARQLGWTIVLIAFGRFLLNRGMRAVVAQGG